MEKSGDFVRFIDQDFAFYGHWYERLRRAAEHARRRVWSASTSTQSTTSPSSTRCCCRRCRWRTTEETILRKMRVTAAFLDILIHRRIWNWRAIDYSTMQYAMFLVMREIRGKTADELAHATCASGSMPRRETFLSNDSFRLHGMNGRQIHRLLARMTEFVETRSGMPSHYVEYAKRGGKDGYEIEHIWADHPERHEDEFAHPSEFAEYRNRIGDLLLLPKSFNASYGDLPYEEKLVHYDSQNLLARSLHEQRLRPQSRFPAVHRAERPALPGAPRIPQGRPRCPAESCTGS